MDWLKIAAGERPDAPALIADGRTVSYGELDRAADGVAAIVATSGRASNHPIGVAGERTIESVAAMWGIPRAGATAVVVDPLLPPAVSMDLTRRAGVRGLWSTPDGGFDRLERRGSEPASWGPPDAAARFVLFTSGSEGDPKGVVITGSNIAASVEASAAHLGNASDDRWLCVLPLFHVGGLSILWRQAHRAAPVVLHDSFDPAHVAAALESVAFASLVPVMLRRVLDLDDRQWTGLNSVLVGGASVPQPLLEEARGRGIPVVPTYGMTETCSQVVTGRPEDVLDGSVGRPLSSVDLEVVVDGQPVVGSEGVIRINGPMVSPGYLGDEERDADWFVTSDIGILSPDGRLTVIGRSDAVIITGGENVHPAQVEAILLGHPAVRAVRVAGVADEQWGERVVADVVTDVPVDDLEAFAAIRLTPAQRPRQWRIVDHIPTKLDT